MSGNSFGRSFVVSTFGESHGPALGCVVDGCPPGLPLVEADLQVDIDRRRTGVSQFVSQRKESDQVRILSGVFQGVTTGTPIGLLIENTDARARDYDKLRDRFRPGHADYTYQQKYGMRDHRGGGRSSARETVMRVAAGAIARKYLATRLGVTFCALRFVKNAGGEWYCLGVDLMPALYECADEVRTAVVGHLANALVSANGAHR